MKYGTQRQNILKWLDGVWGFGVFCTVFEDFSAFEILCSCKVLQNEHNPLKRLERKRITCQIWKKARSNSCQHTSTVCLTCTNLVCMQPDRVLPSCCTSLHKGVRKSINLSGSRRTTQLARRGANASVFKG